MEKKRETFYIVWRDNPQDPLARKAVVGYGFTVHGFEDITFFVHRCHCGWAVSEKETGRGIPISFDRGRDYGYTRAEAITAASNSLYSARKTQDDLLRLLAFHKEQDNALYGIK